MDAIKVTEFRLKLYPKDFVAAKGFYHATLGFPILGEWDHNEQDKGVMFKVGPAILELILSERKLKLITGADVSLEVSDVRALWEELKNKAPVIFELRNNPWGDQSFCIADPEGFELTFFTKTSDE